MDNSKGTVGIALWDDCGRGDLVKDLKELTGVIRKEKRKGFDEAQVDLLEGLELQVEGRYQSEGNGIASAWPNLRYDGDDFLGRFFKKLKLLTVHAPCHERNIASLDEAERKWSVGETNAAMDFTYKIGGSSLVLHPGAVNHWSEFEKPRRELAEERFYESFREMAKHYFKSGYDGRKNGGKNLVLGIENMDPPHLIMTAKEHERVFRRCLEIMFEESGGSVSREDIQERLLKMRIDFSHYWNSHVTLKENPDKRFLEGYDEIVGQDIIKFFGQVIGRNYQRIEGFHMGGCYNNTDRRTRITHGPIMPVPRTYDYRELNLEKVLDTPGVINKSIILEVFGEDPKTLIFSYQNVRDYIRSKRS